MFEQLGILSVGTQTQYELSLDLFLEEGHLIQELSVSPFLEGDPSYIRSLHRIEECITAVRRILL